MINTSNEYKDRIKENREFVCKAEITLVDGTKFSVDNSCIMAGGFGFEEGVSGDGSFDIGAAIIGKCTLAIDNMDERYSQYDFTGAIIHPFIGLQLSNTIESFAKGIYTVDEAKTAGNTISLSALDNLSLFEKEYDSPLNYPATLSQIVRDACTRCGVTLGTPEFDNRQYTVPTKPTDKMTYLDVISYAAQIAGCFAKCNTRGQLEIKWYDYSVFETEPNYDGGQLRDYSTGDTLNGGNFTDYASGDNVDGGLFYRPNWHHIYALGSQTIATDDVVITGIQVAEDSEESDPPTFLSGASGYVLAIDGNPFIQQGQGQAVANFLGAKIVGMRFRPLSVTALSDPAIEAGDTAVVTDRKGNSYRCHISNLSFSVGQMQSLSCDAATPSRNSAAGYSAITKAIVDMRNRVKQEVTERERAIADLTNMVTNGTGLFYTPAKDTNGGDILYAHDKKLLSESMIVWKFTAQAWAVSTDGGKTYPAGFTMDGDMVARMLNVVGLNAEVIDTGELTAIVIRSKDNSSMWDLNTGRLQLTGAVKATAGDFGSPSSQAVGISYLLGGRLFLNTINDYNRGLLQLAGNGVQFMPINCSLYLGSGGTICPYTLNEGGENPGGYTEKHIFNGNMRLANYSQIYMTNGVSIGNGTNSEGNTIYIGGGGLYTEGSLNCGGTKHRVVKTSYGNIGMNAFETMGAHFADFGSGTIGEDGKCYIWLDPVFLQTIDPHQQYQVFLTPTSKGGYTHITKEQDYFIVYGDVGLKFDWQIVAKQRGYQNDRAERVDIDTNKQIDYDMSIFNGEQEIETAAENYLDNYYKELIYD